MTWVLILNSPITAKPPAVIGGYLTRETAEQAGDAATAFKNVQGDSGWYSSVIPYYTSYVVIPGAAVDEPAGSTHSVVYVPNLEPNEYGKIFRKTERFDAPPKQSEFERLGHKYSAASLVNDRCARCGRPAKIVTDHNVPCYGEDKDGPSNDDGEAA